MWLNAAACSHFESLFVYEIGQVSLEAKAQEETNTDRIHIHPTE